MPRAGRSPGTLNSKLSQNPESTPLGESVCGRPKPVILNQRILQEGDNWIDASKLTTGTVIEAILTCGAMLQRDADGRVSASIFTDMDER